MAYSSASQFGRSRGPQKNAGNPDADWFPAPRWGSPVEAPKPSAPKPSAPKTQSTPYQSYAQQGRAQSIPTQSQGTPYQPYSQPPAGDMNYAGGSPGWRNVGRTKQPAAGDGTMYAGGSPYFDERGGRPTDSTRQNGQAQPIPPNADTSLRPSPRQDSAANTPSPAPQNVAPGSNATPNPAQPAAAPQPAAPEEELRAFAPGDWRGAGPDNLDPYWNRNQQQVMDKYSTPAPGLIFAGSVGSKKIYRRPDQPMSEVLQELQNANQKDLERMRLGRELSNTRSREAAKNQEIKSIEMWESQHKAEHPRRGILGLPPGPYASQAKS